MKKKSFYNRLIAVLILMMVSSGVILNIVFKHKETFRADLSKGAITTLKKETIEKLENLSSPVKLTFYISEKKRMPTPMRNVEDDVLALLRVMSRRSNGNLAFEVIYPEDRPQVARGLGRFKISSFQYKTIKQDEYSVSTIWSGMLLEYKGISRAIPYITVEHLPHLENRIVTHINQIDTDYKPFVAVCASDDHKSLRETIVNMNFGSVKNFKFDENGGIPPDADMAFIVQPENLTEKHIENIKKFLADGKDIFIASSNYVIKHDKQGKKYFVIPINTGLDKYFEDKGIKAEKKILLDEQYMYDLPYFITIQKRQVDLDGMRLKAAGTMLYPFASPILIDNAKLKQNGYTADTLIISSDKAWTVPYLNQTAVYEQKIFTAPSEHNRKVENLGIVIASDRPWEGKIFLFSSGFFFADSSNFNGANWLYLKNIFMTFVQTDQLTSIQASKEYKPPLSETNNLSRFAWRFFVVFLFPFMLLIILAAKAFKPQAFTKLMYFDLKLIGIFLAGLVLLLFFSVFLNSAKIPCPDLTENKANSLSPLTIKWIKGIKENFTIYYFSSPSHEMPLSSKKMVEKVTNRLKTIAKNSGGRLKFSFVKVPMEEQYRHSVQDKLDKFDITPFRMKVIEHDSYVEKNIFSGLAFESELHVESVPHLTAQNVDRLEFVVVSALKRLSEQKRPHVAFIADLKHLTPAEFWELEQLDIKIMPKSEDAYRRFFELLRNEGYTVTIYGSKSETRFTEEIMIYIQPWVVTEHMKAQINDFLCSGKSVVLAVQHYNMQARKYSGRAYAMAYWPQPQHSRINILLEPYGIELVEEIFLDQSKAPIDTSEQIRWGAYRKIDKRSPDAQPFIIKAVPANFSKKSPITSHLSDVLFIWGNRWREIKENFPKTLAWQTLIGSSKECWPYNWKGGFFSGEELQTGDYLDISQPLTVLVEGRFPKLTFSKGEYKKTGTAGAEGKLFLIGSSEIFTNEQLDTTRYDHEKFLLNAFADLAYGTELARIQARGGSSSKGFPFVPPAKKMLWRIIILGFAPLAFLIYWFYKSRK